MDDNLGVEAPLRLICVGTAHGPELHTAPRCQAGPSPDVGNRTSPCGVNGAGRCWPPRLRITGPCDLPPSSCSQVSLQRRKPRSRDLPQPKRPANSAKRALASLPHWCSFGPLFWANCHWGWAWVLLQAQALACYQEAASEIWVDVHQGSRGVRSTGNGKRFFGAIKFLAQVHTTQLKQKQ